MIAALVFAQMVTPATASNDVLVTWLVPPAASPPTEVAASPVPSTPAVAIVVPAIVAPPAAPVVDAPASEEKRLDAERARDANVVFLQAFGNGLLYTINYEHIVEPWHLGLRAGASYFTWSVSTYGGSGNLVLWSVPLVASYYVGAGAHRLQLGLGATVMYLGASSDSQHVKFEGDRAGLGVAATASIGYRYVPRDHGIAFGVGFTPLLRPGRLLPWGGLDVGYAF